MRKAAIVCFRYTPEATNKKKCRKRPCENQVISVVSFLTLDKHTICIVMGKVRNAAELKHSKTKNIFRELENSSLLRWTQKS